MMSTLKKAAIWSTILAIVLKLSGFLRESIMAKEFGANEYTDGYLIAFSFITLVVAMISSGFNHAFLPIYIKEKNKNSQLADQNANAVLNYTVFLFLCLSIVVFPFYPIILKTLFPAMNAVTEHVAVKITAIFLPFISLIVLSGILDTYLQSKRSFIPAHVSKLLPTLFAAIFALTLSEALEIYSLIYGFIIGTLLGVFIQFFYLKKNGYHWAFTFNIERQFRKSIIVLFLPSVANSVVGQINMFVDKIFATSTISGAVTYLNNASLIVSIPFTIFSTTIAAIIFTILSEKSEDDRSFERTVFLGVESSVLFLLPVTIGVMLLGDLAISFVYERGEFTSADTKKTFAALIYYAPLILLQGTQSVVSKAIYVKEKTVFLFIVSVSTIVLNVILNYFFAIKLGYIGLALSSSIVSLYYLALTIIYVYRQFHVSEQKKLLQLLVRIVVPCVMMAAVIILIRRAAFLQNVYSLFQLLVISIVAAIVYAIGIYFFYRDGYNRFKKLLMK
ncbi:lipid II flippase MurJ [Aeribacillus sp. FSL W8-0870]|uniref:murein biosynthesis integral membrane protein MurJ n=1 Tax=unclassified Aeribacillus TaxID=2640495 RepID=UPI0030D0DD2C